MVVLIIEFSRFLGHVSVREFVSGRHGHLSPIFTDFLQIGETAPLPVNTSNHLREAGGAAVIVVKNI